MQTKIYLTLLSLFFSIFIPTPVGAQTIDLNLYSHWQQMATGLNSSLNGKNKTAGLSIIVENKNGPFVQIQGGVKSKYNAISGPIGIDLGSIQAEADTQSIRTHEEADWSHSSTTYSGNSGETTVTVSRASPAIVINSSASSIHLFSQLVTNYIKISDSQVVITDGLTKDATNNSVPDIVYSSPKYIGFPTAAGVQIQQIASSQVSLAGLSESWIVLWYGDNSHFADTKKPLSYSDERWDQATLPTSYGYQADAPMVLFFENKPDSISKGDTGGVRIDFTGNKTGNIILLPIFGREIVMAADTEQWYHSSLTSVSFQKALSNITYWKERICRYPISVTEEYVYEQGMPKIIERIQYQNVCSFGSSSITPLPSFLGLIKNSISPIITDVNLNPVMIADPQYPTEFGSYLGIELQPDSNNQVAYIWSMAESEIYVDSAITLLDGPVPTNIQNKLDNEAETFIQAGHIKPWIFVDHIPKEVDRGDIYFDSPADVLLYLSTIYPLLSLPSQTHSIDYLRDERTTYPPETIPSLSLSSGKQPEGYTVGGADIETVWKATRPEVFAKEAPFFNLYALAHYYDITQDPVSDQTWSSILNIFQQNMEEQDWATMFWFDTAKDQAVSVINANRYFAGMVGFIRLAQMKNETAYAELGKVLFVKAITARLAMASYTDYLYQYHLVELPENPHWQPEFAAGKIVGQIAHYGWTGKDQDIRQIITLDPFHVALNDTTGMTWPQTSYPFLVPYRFMVPELARLLVDFVPDQSNAYINAVEQNDPDWYMAFGASFLGREHALVHPMDAYQMFLAKSWIQKEEPNILESYIDIPWIEPGDYFYLHKLAETIKAYRGWCWSDDTACLANVSPTPVSVSPGDTDGDNDVDIFDYNAVITDFGKTGGQGFSNADFDGDGDVDIFDYNQVISNFGR